MLHYETVNTKTLELLNKIQSVDIFKNLRLVGGTSLALQIGHRESIDLDFFGELHIDKFEILSALNRFGKVKIRQSTKNINIFSVNGVKVDIVNYPYPWLQKIHLEDNIKLAGKSDIGAMKLSAITGRGSKKDFIDLFFLLKEFSFKEILSFYETKYHDGSTFLVLRSLAYFDDADQEPMPKMIKNVDWDIVKEVITEKLKKFDA
ncbi:MAG: nucleotidyl transferase AbiEii/AbiGii toxin family protein [Flavobacteriaceae bacterium]|nr:nucleotidyl transferase AbiEii/AbiGii toxin family protein [Flavobacteriaceae bacterium]